MEMLYLDTSTSQGHQKKNVLFSSGNLSKVVDAKHSIYLLMYVLALYESQEI